MQARDNSLRRRTIESSTGNENIDDSKRLYFDGFSLAPNSPTTAGANFMHDTPSALICNDTE